MFSNEFNLISLCFMSIIHFARQNIKFADLNN
jgi:hypothetical protein